MQNHLFVCLCILDGVETNIRRQKRSFHKNFFISHTLNYFNKRCGINTKHFLTEWRFIWKFITAWFSWWNTGIQFGSNVPAGNYMFKVNNRNTTARCDICSKLTINIPERRQWRHSGIFIVNFEHISHLVLVFLLLTLSI